MNEININELREFITKEYYPKDERASLLASSILDEYKITRKDYEQYSDIKLPKEQAQIQILLTLQALPMPKNFNLESIAERIAEHLKWVSDNMKG